MRNASLLSLCASIALFISTSLRAADYDLIFSGGRVVDGTGAPWFRADVGVRATASRRSAISRRRTGERRIDASRLVVAPGFIDMLGQSEYNVLVDARAASKITQGITTEITGEGGSIAPLNARMLADGEEVYEHYGVTPDFTDSRRLLQGVRARAASTINLGTFVGAGGVRNLVIGKDDRRPTPDELRGDGGRGGPGDGGGRLRPLHLAPSTCPTASPRPRRSSRSRRSRRATAAATSPTSATRVDDAVDESLDEVFRIAREANIPARDLSPEDLGQGELGPRCRRC